MSPYTHTQYTHKHIRIHTHTHVHTQMPLGTPRRNRPIQHPAIATFFHDFDDVGGGYLEPKETMREVSFFHMPEWLGL